jgi:hypothetical protein
MGADENVIPITEGRRPGRRPATLTVIAKPTLLRVSAGDAADTECSSGERDRPHMAGGMATAMFRINEENRVEVVDRGDESNADTFASLDELMRIATRWPLRRLVNVWNQLSGVRPITRFENRPIAVRRIWRALTNPSRDEDGTVPARRRSARRRRNKAEVVLQMLGRPEGASLQALMKATKWQAHSVRGFLSGKVSKRLGLQLYSFRRDGERVYALQPIVDQGNGNPDGSDDTL